MATPSFLAHGFAEDRQRGVLKGRSATPAPAWVLLGGRGGGALALGLVAVGTLSGGQRRRLDLALGIIGASSCCSSTSRRQALTVRPASGVGSGQGAARPWAPLSLQRLGQLGDLAPHPALGQVRRAAGSRSPLVGWVIAQRTLGVPASFLQPTLGAAGALVAAGGWRLRYEDTAH
ncbi:MAG: hypothetical protein WCG47_15475 [Dermatophilaceae bacterium]